MCGIFAIHCPKGAGGNGVDVKIAIDMARLQCRCCDNAHQISAYQHPNNKNTLCHHAITDVGRKKSTSGSISDRQVIISGKIFKNNLRTTLLSKNEIRASSDLQIIMALFEALDWNALRLCKTLHGEFDFALIAGDRFLIANDAIGVKSLYYGRDEQGRWYFSTLMKCLQETCGHVELAPFPPGHFFQPDTGFVRYYSPAWFDPKRELTCHPDLRLIRDSLTAATHCRLNILNNNPPVGVLLSGGLAFNLISSLASREMRKNGFTLKSFAIGLEKNASHMITARKVAEFLQTDHHEFYFTVEEGLAALDEIIHNLETYDVNTIRAATPMFILSRKICKLGIAAVLTGVAADDVFCEYSFFQHAQNPEQVQKDAVRRLQQLSTTNCLRADKSFMAHGVEVRMPFLDCQFLDVIMGISPKCKKAKLVQGHYIEKWLLRLAFDTEEEDAFLPPDVLWRQNEQYAYGVDNTWIDRLKEFCSDRVTDAEMKAAPQRFQYNTPHSKEAYYMRSIFSHHFPGEAAAKTVPLIPSLNHNNHKVDKESSASVQKKPDVSLKLQ